MNLKINCKFLKHRLEFVPEKCLHPNMKREGYFWKWVLGDDKSCVLYSQSKCDLQEINPRPKPSWKIMG